MTDYRTFFRSIAGPSTAAHDWQVALAQEPQPRSRVIRIPTGMGKTLGVLSAWLWRRLQHNDDRWPRRLVWCLPMRVLAEQTESVVREALRALGLLWDPAAEHKGKVGVHVLMGGTDSGSEWNLFPEECGVFIGTQDMLLSRALNRGYASGRARWPLEFGLLSHDTLWVMDEVQLMDVGLATSAQLQAFHDQDAAKGFRPRLTWWMSATLQEGWLRTIDTEPQHLEWIREPCRVSTLQRRMGLGAIAKTLSLDSIAAKEATAFAQRALDAHRALADTEYGKITLIVCNTVDRACETFDQLRKRAPAQSIELVHSRFRPAERSQWRDKFLSRAACRRGVDRIVVATQVVEAGVDISAGLVITDLCPWPSLVQRFGRCARYGGSGQVLVVDRGRDEKSAPPYAAEELEAAWSTLEAIAQSSADVGTASLDEIEEGLDGAARARLYPYEPEHLLLRRELDELFDTTADLTGADLDIGRFIRSGDERDLQVFWIDLEQPAQHRRPAEPPRGRRPRREELCAVPFSRARDWLCGAETKSNRKPRLLESKRAWIWDWIDGRWVVAERSQLLPGRQVCVAASSGGYRLDRGFDPNDRETVPVVPAPTTASDTTAQDEADDSEDSERLSEAQRWKTIGCHGGEVADLAEAFCTALQLSPDLRRVLKLAGLWHDLGKAHPAFQGAMGPRSLDRPRRNDLAKAPMEAWLRPPGTYKNLDGNDSRPGLRHELASALALFSVLLRHAPDHPALLGPWSEALQLIGAASASTGQREAPTACEQAVLACSADEFDLLAYLVACHHGKVRVALHAGPKDQEYTNTADGRGLPIRGVRAGDILPAVSLEPRGQALPALTLTLEPASLGLSSQTGRSWRDRTNGLLANYGPGALAWLEALIIAADRRASRLLTADPALASDKEPRP